MTYAVSTFQPLRPAWRGSQQRKAWLFPPLLSRPHYLPFLLHIASFLFPLPPFLYSSVQISTHSAAHSFFFSLATYCFLSFSLSTIHLSTHLFICPSIHPSNQPTIYLHPRPPIHLHTYPFIHLLICSSIHQPIYPDTHPITHPPFYLSFHLLIHSSLYSFIHPPTHHSST